MAQKILFDPVTAYFGRVVYQKCLPSILEWRMRNQGMSGWRQGHGNAGYRGEADSGEGKGRLLGGGYFL